MSLGEATSQRRPVVFIQLHAQYRGVHISLLRRLKQRHGAIIHGFVSNLDQIAFYRERHGDVFETLRAADILYQASAEQPAADIDIVTIGRKHEAYLGTTINTLVMNDRHLGRGFALAGPRHPRSRMSMSASYPSILNAFNLQIGFWRNEFETKKPDLFIHAGKVGCLVARAEGVPVRILVPARWGNRYYWAQNEFFETDEILQAYSSYPLNGSEAPVEAHYGYLQVRSAAIRDASLARTIYIAGHMLAQRLWWTYKGYTKARGYLWRDEIRSVFETWYDMRETRRLSTARLSDMKQKPFVFFPLQTEPENSLQGASPEYFFQLSAIASIARDLPAGTYLVVKEHMSAIGRRPVGFLRQIAAFKNVVLLSVEEFGHEIVQQAAGTVTINSTAGFEAARLGRPVITFGRHNLFNILDHVRCIVREEELRPALAWVFGADHNREAMARNGARFGAALDSLSFDLESFDFKKPDYIDERPAEAAYRSLCRSLGGSSWEST